MLRRYCKAFSRSYVLLGVMGRKWLFAVFRLLHDVPAVQGGLSRAQFWEVLLGFIFNSFYYFFFFTVTNNEIWHKSGTLCVMWLLLARW